MLVTISTTLFDLTVTTYHPDLLMGLLAGAAVMLLIRGSLVRFSGPDAAIIGVLMSAAFMMKPVGSPMLVLLFLATGAAAIALAFCEYGVKTWPIILRTSLLVVSIVSVLAGIFLLWRSTAIIAYIRAGLVEQKDVWVTNSSLAYNLKFYIHELVDMFAWFVVPGAALIIAAVMLTLFRHDWATARRLVVLLLLGVLSYAVPTAVLVKSIFFGGVFYGVVLWTAFYAASIAYGFVRWRGVAISAVAIFS